MFTKQGQVADTNGKAPDVLDTQSWPTFTRHLIVGAHRVKAVQVSDDGGAKLHLVTGGFEPIKLSPDEVAMHTPKAGDWIVQSPFGREVMDHQNFIAMHQPYQQATRG